MSCDCGSCDLVQVKGINAVFNLKMEVTVGENLLTGVSLGILDIKTRINKNLKFKK